MFFFADAMFGTLLLRLLLTHHPETAKLLKIAPFRRFANPPD
jgi:hypothetical protein